MKKIGVVLSVVLAALLAASCASTGGASPDEKAIADGVKAWNNVAPSDAANYWSSITDANLNKQYLGYISFYDKGVAALDSTDSMKATQESKLLSAANTAIDNFSKIDPQLSLPADVCEKGANLSAERVNKLLAAEKISAAKNMYNSAVKIYGANDALVKAGKEVDVVALISSKKAVLSAQADKAAGVADFDGKVAALNDAIAAYKSAESEINSTAAKSGVGDTTGVSANVRSFRKARQDIEVQREGLFRDKAYEYKDKMGEEFARQPAEGSGTGKNGAFTVYDIRNHYNSIAANVDSIYGELLAFSSKYPGDVDQSILDEVKAQRDDLDAKIKQINQEIAVKEEIESRGKTVMPLMIGLFNPAPGSTAESKKSRPAKFSSAKVKKDEYWWGMVSIPKGQMNDLVITLKDNRTVRVFNENTKSGKQIEKKGLKDLVSRANKVGNSWPVMNAGSQLKGNKYFFEIQKGKTDSYSGEVVVYSSFVTRSR